MPPAGEDKKNKGNASPASSREADIGRGPAAVAVEEKSSAQWPAKRSYVQKLAHELKTPISAIVAASEIMRDERLGEIGNDRYREYAADIHDSARLMLAIIDRMLAERSREPLPQPLEPRSLEPETLINATVSSLLPLAQNSGVRLRLVTSGQPLPRLTVDEVSLKQILINLISNALKFTPSGGTITLRAVCDAGGPLSICVEDTGSGMDKADLAAAMRGEPTSAAASHKRGLGLGLQLVQSLMRANGGELRIESAPGQGTQAILMFPRERLTVASE